MYHYFNIILVIETLNTVEKMMQLSYDLYNYLWYKKVFAFCDTMYIDIIVPP